MNNIYNESKEYKDIIIRNEEEENFKKVYKFEEMLEESAALVFAFEKDRGIFKFFRLPKCGKLAVNKISEVTENILIESKQAKCKMINLFDFTNEVYEAIEHYPSVISIVKTDKDKGDFLKALSYFVARHIILHKYKTGKSTTKEIATIAEYYLDMKNSERGIYIGIHQAANKLRDGKLSPKDVMKEMVRIAESKRKELAKMSIAYNGGYLGNQFEMMKLSEENNEILRFNLINSNVNQLKDVN